MQVYDREKRRHMSGYEAAWTAQSFAYELREDSAVILRCFSRDSRAEIPERIDGHLVMGLGDYAFSEHFEEEKLKQEIREGRVKLYVPAFLKIGFEYTRVADAVGNNMAERSTGNIYPARQSGKCFEKIDLMTGRGGGRAEEPTLPSALCGERLEAIVLPSSVQRVGRYCFYNCGNLRRLEFHGNLSDWGSGAFTGCHGVRSLRVYADADGRSHLKDVLDELREELEVEYFTEAAAGDRMAEDSESITGEGRTTEYLKDTGDKDQAVDNVPHDRDRRQSGGSGVFCFARLIFPEFYEEGVENTPARILENHVHGSGILYRNCFRGRVLDFAQYDALFPHARAWENGELVLRMALARLRAPRGLTRKAKEQYETYLAEHAAEAGSWLLGQRDLEGLRFLLAFARGRKGDTGTTGGDNGTAEGDAKKTREMHGLPETRAMSETREIHGLPETRAMSETHVKLETPETRTMPETEEMPGMIEKNGTSGGRLGQILLEEASRMQYMEAVSFLVEYERVNRTEIPSRRCRLEL